MEEIERSKRYIISRTQWIIDESTFEVLDQERAVWIARVTTTHNNQDGNPEETFIVIVQYTEHFVIDVRYTPILLDWFLKNIK